MPRRLPGQLPRCLGTGALSMSCFPFRAPRFDHETLFTFFGHMAVRQNPWYHFGVGAPPILEPILVGIGMFTGGTGF